MGGTKSTFDSVAVKLCYTGHSPELEKLPDIPSEFYTAIVS